MSKKSDAFWAVAGTTIVLFSAMLDPWVTLIIIAVLVFGYAIHLLVRARRTDGRFN